jgi:hypothetical protein
MTPTMTTPLRSALGATLAGVLWASAGHAAEIRGKLTGNGGAPVVKAVIRVLPDAPAVGAKPVQAESGPDGSFVAAGLAGESFRIRIEAKGYATITQPLIPAGASLQLHLKAGVKVAGIVRDRTTKGPIAGAAVRAWEKDAEAFGEDAYRKATTGKDGRFVIDDLPGGKATVEAKATGHAPSRATGVVLPKSELELLLDIPGGLSGTVTNTVGDPVAGAEVVATLRGAAGTRTRSAKTGADGHYRIADVGTDPVSRMTVKAPKFLLFEREGGAPSDGVVDFTLEHGGSVSGTVHGYDGKSPATFTVKAKPDAKSKSKTAPEKSFTDPSGAFQIDDLDPGKYTIEVSADHYATVSKTDLEVSAEQVADAGTLTLASQSALRGHVIAARERTPVAGAAVQVTFVSGPQPLTAGADSSWSVTSGPDGAFTTPALPAGTFDLACAQPQFAPAHLQVTFQPGVDAPEVVLELSRGGILTGTVVDAKLDPVPGAHISATQGGEGDSRAADTGSDGHYYMEGLAPGSWTVTRQQDRPSGSPSVDTKYATIVEGQTTTIDFDEKPRVLVSGMVMQGENPMPGVSIYFVSIDPNADHDGKSSHADANGAYQIGLVHGGRYQVSVVFGTATTTNGHSVVTVSIPDQPEVRQDIVFTVQAMTGHVYDPDRKGISGALITALRDGAAAGDAPRQATTMTKTDGSFRLEAVDPGTYRVTAKAKGFSSGEQYPITVSDAQGDPDLDFTLTRGWMMKGHVFDPTGRPLVGALVVVAPDGAAESGYIPTQSDATGAFKITAPSDGAVNVAAIAAHFAPAVQTGIDQSNDDSGGDVQLHATVGGSLRIRVVHKSGDPVGGAQLAFQPAQLFPGADVFVDRNRPKPTGTDGTTVIPNLYPGNYMVSYPGRRDVPVVQASVSEGSESDLEISVP